MNQSINHIIEQVKQGCHLDLSGKEAQYLMAPEKRIIDIESAVRSQLRKAAVLVPLFFKDNQWTLLLTQRANYKGNHGGEISFPGGKWDQKLDANLQETALRETFEEIGLNREHIQILQALSPLNIPISKILVHPYWAIIDDIQELKIDEYEVVDTYFVPLSLFFDEKNIHFIQKQGIRVPYYNYQGKEIWGATAMIISELVFILRRAISVLS